MKSYALLVKVQSSFSDVNFKVLGKLIKVFTSRGWRERDWLQCERFEWKTLSKFEPHAEKFNHFRMFILVNKRAFAPFLLTVTLSLIPLSR